ncbi:hypothetical protein HPB52_024468 [Rhipicephalus sanguineus]|uniref:Hikeshi-like N-terminal domain-containing protein n=1 Tax=Rhipicephalus sanguineus TaxID=34632 RepID=A0A9D4TC81_RHISA|nr:hypothetical protein HPB52_024468 [Rhipicephalus sanguineus]
MPAHCCVPQCTQRGFRDEDGSKAHDDELPSADVAFDDLRAGGVLIPAEITLEGFADADKDLELCAELTDDEIIHQVTEDSDDSDTENEEPAPTQPTSSELTRALMTLSLVYSGNMTLTEIEADIIAGKRTVQKKISDFFAPIEKYLSKVYFCYPSPDAVGNWQLLGFISNAKPSAIFRISKHRKECSEMHAFSAHGFSSVAQLGISVEPLAQIQ